MSCIIKIDGAKKGSGRESRGNAGNTHRPWNDQIRSVEDLLGVGMSAYTTPIIQHLKSCNDCRIERIMHLLETENVAVNSRSERIPKAFFNDPRISPQRAARVLVKLQGFNSLFWLGTKLSKDDLFDAIRLAVHHESVRPWRSLKTPVKWKTRIPFREAKSVDIMDLKAEDALRMNYRFGPERSKYASMPSENRELLIKAATMINSGAVIPNTMEELEQISIVHQIQTS